MEENKEKMQKFFVLTALFLGFHSSHAAEVRFDFEDQGATCGGDIWGLLPHLQLQRGNFRVDISRPKSNFDVNDNANSSDRYKIEAPSWGARCLSLWSANPNPAPLTLNFSRLVEAFEVDIGDCGEDEDFLQVEAWSGPNGSGTRLAAAESGLAAGETVFGFQAMRVAAPRIASITIRGGNETHSQSIYVDNFVIDMGENEVPISPRSGK